MKTRRGAAANVAKAAVLLLLCGAWYGCHREPSSSEKASAPAPVVEQRATVAPSTPSEAATDEEMDDDLVLFAEGDPEEGVAPLTVRFQAESLVETALEEPQYTWDFGDGSAVSRDANPTHTYERSGEYTVTVRVVDAKGQRGWDEVDILVDPAEGS